MRVTEMTKIEVTKHYVRIHLEGKIVEVLATARGLHIRALGKTHKTVVEPQGMDQFLIVLEPRT